MLQDIGSNNRPIEKDFLNYEKIQLFFKNVGEIRKLQD